MDELSLLFKALGEPLRLRIVQFLLNNGQEAYGGELAKAVGIPAYSLSRHLKVLRNSGLIHERREGRWVYYSLSDRAHVLESLGPIIAKADAPIGKEDDVNWNQGPAVPGML